MSNIDIANDEITLLTNYLLWLKYLEKYRLRCTLNVNAAGTINDFKIFYSGARNEFKNRTQYLEII